VVLLCYALLTDYRGAAHPNRGASRAAAWDRP
jgi:hypothetical protein